MKILREVKIIFLIILNNLSINKEVYKNWIKIIIIYSLEKVKDYFMIINWSNQIIWERFKRFNKYKNNQTIQRFFNIA
jgi:hypothetical protein